MQRAKCFLGRRHHRRTIGGFGYIGLHGDGVAAASSRVPCKMW
jgi:hypothetical protein